MHGDERSARLCTSRIATNRPHTRGDQRKRVTAIYWGSSGRRFQSCQPDSCQPDRYNRSSEAISLGSQPSLLMPQPGMDSNADSNGCSAEQAKPTCQSLNRSPCHAVRRMAVDVTGDRDRGVPEQVGNRLDMHPRLQPRPTAALCRRDGHRCRNSQPSVRRSGWSARYCGVDRGVQIRCVRRRRSRH